MTTSLIRSRDYVADPTTAYSLDAVWAGSASNHLNEWLSSSPWTWVALGLFAALVAITIWRRVLLSIERPGQTPGFVYTPIALGVLIWVVGLIIAAGLSADSTEDTFSTWAKQRYGIELESYPSDSVLELRANDDNINTDTVIRLDDGQMIHMQKITDARGDEAYLIAPAEGSGEELDVIVDDH